MKKNFLIFSTIVTLSGCQSIGDQITLPNGKQGLAVDCSNYGWSNCFKIAGDACPGGYTIHERSMDENTKSEIPVEPLETENASVGHRPDYNNFIREKYMVISCK